MEKDIENEVGTLGPFKEYIGFRDALLNSSVSNSEGGGEMPVA